MPNGINHAHKIATWMIENPGHSLESALGIYLAQTGINRCWIPTRVLRAFESELKSGCVDLLRPLAIATADELDCRTYPDPIETAKAIVNQRKTKRELRSVSRGKQRDRTNQRIEDAMYERSKIS